MSHEPVSNAAGSPAQHGHAPTVVAKHEPGHADLLVRLEALERAHRPHSLWKNTALLGLVGTLIAVVPPSLTAIHEYYQTEREVRLSLARYQHERTLSYLDRALSPETEEAKQAQVFRFLRHLPEEDPVRQWATEELAIVQVSIAALKEEIAANELRLQQLELEKKATVGQAAAAIEAAAPKQEIDTVVQAAQLEVESYEREIEQIQEQTKSLKVRAGEAPARRPEAATPALDVGAPMRPLSRPSQWRLWIATASTLADARTKAAKVAEAGEEPAIYRKSSVFYVMVGRYASRQEAAEDGRESSRHLGRGARPIDLMAWCSSQRPQDGYTECAP